MSGGGVKKNSHLNIFQCIFSIIESFIFQGNIKIEYDVPKVEILDVFPENSAALNSSESKYKHVDIPSVDIPCDLQPIQDKQQLRRKTADAECPLSGSRLELNESTDEQKLIEVGNGNSEIEGDCCPSDSEDISHQSNIVAESLGEHSLVSRREIIII